MHIILPVAPISRKILLHDYQEEPISPGHSDLLFHQLCYARPGNIQWSSYFKLLSQEVKLVMTSRFRLFDKNQLFQSGYLLYVSHIDRMLHWVEAQTLVTGNAWGAIEAFYEMHDIDEDDFAVDTAYKRWQRYQDGLHYDVRESRFSNAPTIRADIPYTIDMCNDLASMITTHLHDEMYSPGDCFNIKTVLFIQAWVLYTFGRMPGTAVASYLKVTQRKVYTWIKQADDWIVTYRIRPVIDSLAEVVRQAA